MTKGVIYHLLGGPLGEEVTVAQIVHFDVLDIIAVCNVDLAVDVRSGSAASCGVRSRRLGSRFDRRNINMLDALLRLNLRIDLGSGGSCEKTKRHDDGQQTRQQTRQKR